MGAGGTKGVSSGGCGGEGGSLLAVAAAAAQREVSSSTGRWLPGSDVTLGCLDEERVCPICQEGFDIAHVVVHMPCQHCYHDGCLMEWLKRRNTCPSCRFELNTGNAAYDARVAQRYSEAKDCEGRTAWHSWFG